MTDKTVNYSRSYSDPFAQYAMNYSGSYSDPFAQYGAPAVPTFRPGGPDGTSSSAQPKLLPPALSAKLDLVCPLPPDDVFRMGKHKGKTFKETCRLFPGYGRWLVKYCDSVNMEDEITRFQEWLMLQ